MRPEARREHILEAVLDGPISVEELADRFGVTASTIRRDLAQMKSAGLLLRTYGGAASALQEQGIDEREQLARQEKAAIARVAATYVEDGHQVYLDAGTTCGALAGLLVKRHDLTVVTSGLSAIDALSRAEAVETILLGGSLRAVSRATVGPYAELVMRRLQLTTAFLGADAVDPDQGLCEASPAQAALKDLVISRASTVVVVADSTKLGTADDASGRVWTPLDVPWTLVTDWRATPAQLAPFRRLPACTVQVARPL
ncbi:MAG: DeoR/GlpR family DNA-binding transcription regulator [Micromonosporaceae bacterium]